MARVFIDIHVFGESWFQSVLPELIRSEKVRFSYPCSKKFKVEGEKCRKALEFYKLMGATRLSDGTSKREDTEPKRQSAAEAVLLQNPTFAACDSCDDPHIMALVAIKPTPFVFSKDKRIAKCRRTIGRAVERKYCRFSVISSGELYTRHKERILR